ncbi:MAG: acyl--CoA ligase [Bacilli bacterium]|nr:acyl--CoA ligase [Bacilli bacterium]
MNLDKMTMYQAVKKAALEYPNGLAIYYRGKRISYRKLLNDIDRMADIFYNVLGVRKDDVILIAQPNIPDTLVMFYALNKIGAIVNFAHPFTPYNQIISILGKTKSKYLLMFEQRIAKEVDKYREISDKIYVTRIENYLPCFSKAFYHCFMNNKIRKKLGKTKDFDGFKYVHNLKPTNKPVLECFDKLDQCSVLLHSGSTTGDPKTIMLNDKGFNYITEHTDQILCIDWEKIKGIKMLNVLPSFHGFGLAMTMHLPLATKMGLVMIPKFTPKEVTKALKRTKFEVLCGVPTMYEKLFAYKPFVESQEIKHFIGAFSGGDYMKPSLRNLMNEVFEKSGSICRVLEGYGLTEVIAVNSVNTINNLKNESIGKPIAEAQIRIEDEEGNEVKRNEVGEIVIKSPSVMLGYFKDEEATNQTLKDGWLHTGDLGYMDEDGFIFFKSRRKRVVKVSGVAVFPSEVEALVSSIPEVISVAAIEIPNAKLQSSIKIFVVAKYFDEEGMKSKILETCRKYLIRWAVPTEIEFRKDLPVTKLGKVDYRTLQSEENAKRGL